VRAHPDVAPTTHFPAVFLSPHLDDAVFSCAGLISRLSSAGHRPLVINVFSTASQDFKPSSKPDDGRVAEEYVVSGYLGFYVRLIGELDAFFRGPAYKSLTGLFMARPGQYLQELRRIQSVIAAALRGITYDVVYAPLAIGWHVDHLLTHLAARAVVEPSRLRFYEDAPYVLLPHFQTYRLGQLDRGAGLPAGSRLRHALEASRFYARTAVMRNKLGPWRGAVAQPVLDVWFYRLFRNHAGVEGDTLSLEPVLEDVTPALGKKVQAYSLYRSQFPHFFGGRDECATLLTDYSKRIGGGDGYCERYWAMR
jgi:LmbE family N-acetylglucosaminyl deacetylase